MSAALPYHEPGIVDILILSSFLFILNVLNSIIDSHLYCGLISQILIGIAWGAPGAAWLSFSSQETITQLGYLGLILLVFEGGLSTSIPALKSNLLLSVAVATVGIVLPLALSFSLMGLADATPLQAFAAGAALCSTSLGTTFTLLSSSGLVTSRLGVVLSSAAMLDDVVGLVMVQIISNLGTSSSLSAVIIIRPILVSLGFATILPVVCVFIFKPVMYSTFGHSQRSILKWRKSNAHGFHIPFITQTLLLVTFITGASYAGTSTLFTAYLAGATISWWDAEKEARNRVHSASFMDPAPSANVGLEERDNTIPSLAPEQSRSCASEKTHHRRNQRQQEEGRLTGAEIYTHYVENAVRRILKPFFFASIGFSIPISKMFSGSVVWRGIVYTILMVLGKLACGLWLLPLRGLPRSTNNRPDFRSIYTADLYPVSILGFAMVARGEIGFLISSIAESDGIFIANGNSNSDTTSDLFLIVCWAIVICTVIGPICVGLLVRKIQRSKVLEGSERQSDNDPWGIRTVRDMNLEGAMHRAGR